MRRSPKKLRKLPINMYSDKHKYQIEAGRVAFELHRAVKKIIAEGVNILEIESLVSNTIAKHNMTGAFKGYHGYPANSCISVNDEVVHSIPRNYNLKANDLITVDFGIRHGSYCVDTARSYIVGSNAIAQKMIDVATEALEVAISKANPSVRIGVISNAINQIVENGGFAVIKDLQGHGIGKELQERPHVPNFGSANSGEVLKVGDSIAIEPIISQFPTEIKVLDDGWNIVTVDQCLAVQVEDTVIITNNGPKNVTGESDD